MLKLEIWNAFSVINYAKVDDDIFWLVKHLSFTLNGDGYPQTWMNKKRVKLHHIVLPNNRLDMERDHIDRDILNCQRVNLRLVTKSQNRINRGAFRNNTSGYRNIHWDTTHGKWVGIVKKDSNTVFCKYYIESDIEIAVKEVEAARILHHGEYAPK